MVGPTIVTTSRDPSRRTRSLVKDIVMLAPWLVRINRGKMTLRELLDFAVNVNARTLAIVCEKKANPSIIRLYDLEAEVQEDSVMHAYTIFFKGVALSRERSRKLTSRLKVSKAEVVLNSEPASENERNAVAALIKMFNARLWNGTWKSRTLYIMTRQHKDTLVVSFALWRGSNSIEVGPILKVAGVKRVERYVRLF
uniref:Probable Brix domain-containing ribosomal biogenesis protein n=1 Tax=Fervidicoccus fontis TaxID=683846 RepID=A0A7J3ZLF4_9CREN